MRKKKVKLIFQDPTVRSNMDTYWVPGVNNLGSYGRWAFAEFTEVYQIESDFEEKVEDDFNKMIEGTLNREERK